MGDSHEHSRKSKEISERMQKITEPIRTLQEVIHENLQEIFKPINEIEKSFQGIGEQLKAYEEETPRHLLKIAVNGWFLEFDSELSLPSKLVFEIENNNVNLADQFLIDYYTDNLERIVGELQSRHQNRHEIFEGILTAHTQKNYFVCIPTVLSQVDGICFDFTKKKFFIKDGKNSYLPQITTEIEKISENFIEFFLSPLKNQVPIAVNEKYLSQFPCNLNRHEIVHGVNTTYGTKINSLKCISLLKYLSDLLTELEVENKNNNAP